MALYNRVQVGLNDTSVDADVSNDPRARLMYYLNCVYSVLNVSDDDDIQRLRNYRNYSRLSDQDVILLMKLCFRFHIRDLINKCFFQDDGMCGDSPNRFFKLEMVRHSFIIAGRVLIGGRQQQVTSIMTFKISWLERNLVIPLQTLVEQQERRQERNREEARQRQLQRKRNEQRRIEVKIEQRKRKQEEETRERQLQRQRDEQRQNEIRFEQQRLRSEVETLQLQLQQQRDEQRRNEIKMEQQRREREDEALQLQLQRQRDEQRYHDITMEQRRRERNGEALELLLQQQRDEQKRNELRMEQQRREDEEKWRRNQKSKTCNIL